MSTSHATFRIDLDGTEQTFSCPPDDTLLRASLRAGMGFSYECNAGSCGSCKIRLINGQLDDLYPQATGIKPRDRERGFWLACQSVPRSNCTVKARLDESCVPHHRPRVHGAQLAGTRDITHDIREFTFQTQTAADFLPGQYAMLQLPGAASPRAYSMSNVPNAEGHWQFMVRRTTDGLVSNALFQMSPGASVMLDGPYGNAYLRADSPRDIVCIAGGSGMAPMMSILKAAVLGAASSPRHAWLFQGGRGPQDIPEIQHICHPLPHSPDQLTWCPVVSDIALGQSLNWSGHVGFVHEHLPSQLPRPLSYFEYYFAGPPPMIEATVRMLTLEHKVPQSQMHFDRFF